MTYTYDDVLHASLEYFNEDSLAAEVFAGKYALRDLKGNLYEQTPADMHRRLSSEFARIEGNYDNPMSEDEIFELFNDWSVIAQGSPMSAIGNEFQIQSLSNCFVIESPHDSYGGILKADQEQAQIMKRRGGVGFDISTIRPRGQVTSNAARTTDGIGVFMERFSNTCREVAQGGRRGALMLTISVHHPEIRTFINIKRNRDKVTGANISIRLSDEFMNAVKTNSKVQLRFPVEADANHQIEEYVDAAELWNEIIEAAHESAEPGLLFWDTVKRMGPADAYEKFGYGSTSTNPCLAYDTRIAVADGRGYVEIGKLAEEGLDVPVYAVDSRGKIIIKKMRNPRLTGKNKPVYRVTIEGGHSFKATSNHRMIMRDRSEKRVDELKPGDQLWTAFKATGRFHEAIPGYRATQSQDYHWIKDCNSMTRYWKSEHRMIWEHHNGCVPSGYVIHHVDFYALNNSVSNLRCMSKIDHDALHAAEMRGEKNPIFKIKADPKRFAEYSAKMSESVGGENNPRAYSVTHDEIRTHVKLLTQKLGRRVSIREWYAYAKTVSLPMSFSAWRKEELGTFYELSSKVASSLGMKNVDVDTRVQSTLQKAHKQGYDADIVDGEVVVSRECEWCRETFINAYERREIAFCSHSCSNFYANRKAGRNEKRTASLQEMHTKKAFETRKKILDLYTQLRLDLGREPMRKELQVLCDENNVSFRTGTKNGFKNWKDVKQHAATHNHRVVSVEYVGEEDVFNGTVDDEHTLCIAMGEEQHEQFAKNVMILIGCTQCGEITLSPYDSCRLLLVNLTKFVSSPFTPNAKFEFKRFETVVEKAQRLMDDLVDLELEAVDRILTKIQNDPEPDYVKRQELDLWKKIRNAAINGRRTGLGITGLGDALAMVGIRYGSDKAVKKTDRIYKSLAVGSYRSSVQMAKERGPFPVYSYDVEKDHEFINRIMQQDEQLAADYKKYGRRNIANTTTAPAGSVSILAQSTSGCEPAFLLSYKRRKKINPNDDSARVDFVDDLGDKWQVYDVVHHGFKMWADINGHEVTPDNVDELIAKSPYHKATSNDTHWVKKIEMQAAAQKWICHSISNTTNLPNDITVDVVKDIYMKGWETGCKGVTIYRDGCRDGVLVKNDDVDENGQPVEIYVNHAPKRPKELQCDIHRATVKGEQYMVIVGLLNDRPYEIFCGLSEHIDVPKKKKSGSLVKNGKVNGIATYNLKIPVGDDDEMILKNVVELFDNPTYGAFTRSLSLALRHGVPVQYIVEQLRKDKHSDITSFASAVARILSKSYIPDGTSAITAEKKCQSCGSTNLAYQQGCITCMNCGSSKCG